MLIKKNAVYCSHIFSLLGFLPIIIFLAQWSIYIALIADQTTNIEMMYNRENLLNNSFIVK